MESQPNEAASSIACTVSTKATQTQRYHSPFHVTDSRLTIYKLFEDECSFIVTSMVSWASKSMMLLSDTVYNTRPKAKRVVMESEPTAHRCSNYSNYFEFQISSCSQAVIRSSSCLTSDLTHSTHFCLYVTF